VRVGAAQVKDTQTKFLKWERLPDGNAVRHTRLCASKEGFAVTGARRRVAVEQQQPSESQATVTDTVTVRGAPRRRRRSWRARWEPAATA